MWYTALASALLGASVALVTSEPNVRQQVPPTSERISLRGVTCQVRPDARLVVPEPCQAGAARGEDCDYYSFISLSEDAALCDLISLDTLDRGLQFTPFCNETQMTACAEAVGSPWNQNTRVVTKPILQVLVAPIVDVPVLDARFDVVSSSQEALPVAPAAHHTGVDTPIRGRVEEDAELFADTLRQLKAAADRPVGAQVVMEFDEGSSGSTTLGSKRAPIQPVDASQLTEKPRASKPTGSGNKQLAGMAAGLATVLIIFVVWL